ncbi:MAG: Holliday junction branch migration protein RuvA [Thermomicrobiales bacterium]
MIAGLIGTVHEAHVDSLLVNVGGVVYRVMTSGRTIAQAGERGEPVELQTHLVVRDDAMILYGFLTKAELQWFETLIGVTGVGPRLACAVLTRFTPDELFGVIEREEVAVLSSVSGIGKRTASRILLDLRGKLPPDLTGATPTASGATADAGDRDVVEALQALGYTLAEAREAIARSDPGENPTVETRIVAALKEIGG